MTARLAAAAFCVALSPVTLSAASQDELVEALQIPRIVGIMQQEGVRYSEDIAADMLGEGPNAAWSANVARIYDAEKMEAVVRDEIAGALTEAETEALLEFFETPLGVRVVTLEVDAREAMLDPDVEEAAREAYRDVAGTDAPELARIEAFVAANDLVERNVEGALNASLMFYRGLADGGALEMSEDEMLDDVWSQEAGTREDTSEWLHGFLMLAYEPLSDAELADYTEMSESEVGRALNGALFQAFNRMYDDVSYAMGLAVARQMSGTEL
ncbi:DUF2059 domain-containing protein [Roseivivax isoporae]|uniref:Ribosomal protein L21 n=1 Tax=Roseivivax isoporae LMG 25204 TaxID=1449351 RepID=X7F3U6_9RHOB|nr:DUF2059 domain-containing protein [Roseivivax isoporae]ETX27557.1 ribosomal protein L21 [Roseivivax isoporae LMG 25204]